MEIIRTKYYIKLVRFCLFAFLFLYAQASLAQSATKKYTIKNGRMYIELGKAISNPDLDRFIAQYNLQDLPLKHLIRTSIVDSMKKLGWNVQSNRNVFLISKPLFALSDIGDPLEKIIFTQKQQSNLVYPENMGKIVYGYNRFQSKYPFAVNESTVTFFLKNNLNAKRVMLTGSFNRWVPDALAMRKTDSGWIAYVKLDPGKYWYKFIIDGSWRIDTDNALRENDGRGNVNSVFYKTNFIFRLDGFLNIRKAYLAGSFNNWRSNELIMNKIATGWQLQIYLAQGTHTYKFTTDGKWISDPKNDKHLPDGSNGYNSVIEVGKPHIFRLNGYLTAKQVTVMGSFNNWRGDEIYMRKTAGGWQLPYVLGPGNYEYKFIVDGKHITDPENPLLTNSVKSRANSFLIVEPNYTFRLKGFSNAKNILLAGDFNNWNEYSLRMNQKGDEWSINVTLAPGKHLYKFIVDGKWIIDPANKLWEQNEHGTGNSVLWIEK